MSRKSVLVIGANRGIGLQLVKRLIHRNWVVNSSVRPQTRDDESVRELGNLGTRIFEIDYLNEDTLIAAAKQYGSEPLDMLVNCGGVGPGPEDWWAHDKNTLLQKFTVNAVDLTICKGPFLAIKHFYPALKRSSAGKIVNISSNSASAQRNNGKDMGYRMSKAALTMQTVTFAKEFEESGDKIAIIAIYPGYVATRMSNYRSKNDMAECMDGTIQVMEEFTLADSGKFLDWKGEPVPW